MMLDGRNYLKQHHSFKYRKVNKYGKMEGKINVDSGSLPQR